MPPKLMLVDEESICLDLICHYLDGCDYEIVRVRSGPEALSVLNQAPTDCNLVLLDKFMDGMALLSQIKTDPDLKILPVILQTTDNSADKLLEAIRAGACYYLPKPFSRDQLQALVSNALNQNRYTRLVQEELRLLFLDERNQAETILLLICIG